MSITHLAIPGLSQTSVTLFHNPRFSKCQSHVWQYQDFSQMAVTQSHNPGFSKCLSHIWQYQDFPYCLSLNLNPGFSNYSSHTWQYQDFPKYPSQFLNNLLQMSFSKHRIFQMSVTNLLTQDFLNVHHLPGNTRISPNVRHTVS